MTIASPPVVSFTVIDSFGKAVVGLGNTSKSATAVVASYPNLSFALAKLVPGTSGAPSKWVSYIVTSVPSTTTAAAAPSRPSTDNTGTLVDNGDGTYKYTFYRDITTDQVTGRRDDREPAEQHRRPRRPDLQPALTHRVTIALSGSAPATGSNTPTGATSSVASVPMKHPANAIYDFIPATGAKVTAADFSREIVAVANCEACHRQLGGIPGLSEAERRRGFHGGSRNETQYCVVCHTDQRRYGQKEATFTSNGAIRTFTSETRLVDGRTVGNFPNYIHKIHMGPAPGPREVRLRRRPARAHDVSRRTSATARRAMTARARPRARPRPRTATTGRPSRARWPAAPAMTASTSRPAPASR